MVATGKNKIKGLPRADNLGEHIFIGIVSAIFNGALILLFKFPDEIGVNVITPVKDIENRFIFAAGIAKNQQTDYHH